MRHKTVGYVSEIDKFQTQFDQTHPLSESQKAEIEKYKRIMYLRDHPVTDKAEREIWEGF